MPRAMISSSLYVIIYGASLVAQAGKESTCNWGDLGSIPELGRSPGEGKGYPLQYSGLENSMDYTWGHKELLSMGSQSQTQLSDLKKKKEDTL